MKYEIVSIDKLKPLEMVFPHHLKNLTNMIKKDGFVKQPIIADRNTGIVLDGSHRYIFFLQEGYAQVPVRFVNYDDENIRVGTHLMHKHIIEKTINISKTEVKKRGLSGNLFSPRTTRHFFPFRKTEEIDYPLDRLTKKTSVDVVKYIAAVSIDQEIEHNLNFINEIEQEIDEIIRYMDEVRQTKNYLKKQVCKMQEEKKILADKKENISG